MPCFIRVFFKLAIVIATPSVSKNEENRQTPSLRGARKPKAGVHARVAKRRDSPQISGSFFFLAFLASWRF